MPSFPVNNGSYEYYLNLSQASIFDSSINGLIIFTILSILAPAVSTSIGFTLKHIALQYPDWYWEHNMYFPNDLWRIFVQSLICGQFIYLIFMNRSPVSKTRIFFIWFTSNIVIAFTIILVLSYFHHFKNLNEIHVFPENNGLCDIVFQCHMNTPFILTQNSLFPMFVPIITFISIHILTQCEQQQQRRRMTTTTRRHQLSEPFITIEMDSIQTCETPKNKKENIKQWVWIYIFLSIWSFLCLFLSLNYSIKSSVMKDFWEMYYFWLLCVTSAIKFCLKRCGRKLDEFRLSQRISVEYLMEFIGSSCYWIVYRVAISYHTVTVPMFALTLLTHTFCEIFQCSIRISDLYFGWSNRLIDHHHKWMISVVFYKVFADECTVQEWRIRIAMDIMQRIYVSIITGVLVQIYIFIVPVEYFEDWQRTKVYNAVATIMEFVYFAIVLVIFYKYYNVHMLKLYAYYIENIANVSLLLFDYMFVFAFFSLITSPI